MKEPEFDRQLGKRIAEAQEKCGLDDFDVAAVLKCDRREIKAYREGRNMRIARLVRLAKALNVTVDELTRGIEA